VNVVRVAAPERQMTMNGVSSERKEFEGDEYETT
jgi:hypothetical protein